MKAYIDISSLLDEFYVKCHNMNYEHLVETSKIVQDFLRKYIDTNSNLFKKGVKVMLEIYKTMGLKFKETHLENL